MDIAPILKTLRRHKTAAALIVLEIALTSAIVCNALHLITTRVTQLQTPTGLVEDELVVISVRGTGNGQDADGTTAQDLQALRALPGVKGATITNQVVYGNSSSNTSIGLEPGQEQSRISAANYIASEGFIQTLGLKLVEGRDFKPEEYQLASVVFQQADPTLGAVIINRGLAQRLWPGEPAVGKSLYIFSDSPLTVVGVVEQLPHPHPVRTPDRKDHAFLLPLKPDFADGPYLLRTEPAQREALLKAATAALERVDATRVVSKPRLLTEMRSAYYAQDRAMVGLMGGVIVALMVVTAFGIVGLASFWVQQRTRMIGTRRALGATRAQIRGYFQLENFLLASLGIALGMAGAVALNQWLMQLYALPQLPLHYLPIAALALWGLGQVAVLGPARRAAAVPPVQALRS